MEPINDEFKVYPKRFVIVFLFSLAQLMTSVLINTLTPIARYLEIIYDQDPLVVNSGALFFTLMHPLFTFPAAFVIDTYGTRVGIGLGSALCLIGTALRLLVNQSFVWVILGQIIAGIGRPFILNCQGKISANWFKAETRGGVTQLLTLVLNVSLIIGIFIPGIVFKGYDIEPVTAQNIETGKDLTFKLMVVQTILAAICYIPNILFQQNNPPTPPSSSSNVKRQPFKKAISALFRNKSYILLLIAFGCYFGIFNGISIVLSYMLTPWFSSNLPLAVGVVGGSPIISGIIGVIILGPMQRKSGQFKKYIIICMIGSCSAMIFFYPLLQTGILALASLVSAYNSFFLIPLVPIMLELSCQIAFPVGEGAAVGLLFAMGNFAGFVLGFFLSLIVQGQSKAQTGGGLAFCFGVFLIGLALVWFMKEQKNRLNHQKRQSELRTSTLSTKGDQSVMISLEQSSTTDKQGLKQQLLTINPAEENALL